MKRMYLLFLGMLSGTVLMSQSLQDARKMLYYQRYKSAIGQLQSVVKAKPDDAEAWYWLTEAYLGQNEVKTIRDSLMLAPAEVKEDPMFQAAYGHVLIREKKADSAQVYFDAALKKTKQKNPDVLHAIATSFLDADSVKADYAIELMNKAIKRDKKNPALYTTLGDLYRKKGDGSSAYREYQHALLIDNNYAEAMYKTGKIFTSQNNPEMYLKFFNQAINADTLYKPAIYEMYYHYYFRDVNAAMNYLKKYIAASDPGIENEYMMTDLLYASRKYEEAIQNASKLVQTHEKLAEPRLYKLIAYSYQELKKPDSASFYMHTYFREAPDSTYVLKDFETMADIYAALDNKKDSVHPNLDSAIAFYKKAMDVVPDSTMPDIYKKIADVYKGEKKYEDQAYWQGRYFTHDSTATNLDLFNWGVAHYMAGNYQKADSVFGMYTTQYPDQPFGYYWRARSNVAIDTAMEQGLAIPHYEKLIELSEKDTSDAVNKKRLIEAYAYIAAYKANTQKDFQGAINYFEKLLQIQPGNTEAQKYIDILKQTMTKTETESETGK